MSIREIAVVLTCLFLAACSTREVVQENRGATEQRLITYSIEDLIEKLPAEDFEPLRGKKLALYSHFIVDDQRLKYAESLMKSHLSERFDIHFVIEEQAEYRFDVYYQTMSTDTDTFGFSIPLVDATDAAQHSEIPLVALEMYHGIAECRYFIQDLATGKITGSKRYQARTRTDNVSTPFFSFPWSHL